MLLIEQAEQVINAMEIQIIKRSTKRNRELHGEIGSASWSRDSASHLPSMRSVACELGLLVADGDDGWTASMTYHWPRNDCGDERTMTYQAESIVQGGEMHEVISYARA